MDNRTRIIILWLMFVVCMILHFNYHVSGIFYGIDVERPTADGTFPPSLIIIRLLFQHLPLLYIVALMFFERSWARITNLVLSALYTLANAFHLVGELAHPPVNPSQAVLLVITLLLSLVLVTFSLRWMKEPQTENQTN